MVVVRRYFLELTSLDDFKDEDFVFMLSHIMSNINVKIYRSSIIEVRHER